MSARFDLQAMINNLPAGLDRTLLRTLSFRVGKNNAIKRSELIAVLLRFGFDFRKDDRTMRLCLNQLRKQGVPICSAGGKDGGYWIASNWSELMDYLKEEVHSRAMDLLEQEQAMKSMARKMWGEYRPDMQSVLF